jgi:hypothetical protein
MSYRTFLDAIRRGDVGAVSFQLAGGLADPTTSYSDALPYAAQAGHLGVFITLLADGRADPAA